MNVGISSLNGTAKEAIRQLLSPWDITYVHPEKADVVISYDDTPGEGNASLVIPSEGQKFHKWLTRRKIEHSRKKGVNTNIQATPEIQLPITPKSIYCYSSRETGNALAELEKEDVVLLTFDVIDEYKRRVEKVTHPKVSKTYQMATRMPTSYRVVPSRVRNIIFRSRARRYSLYTEHLSLDALRYLLVKALQRATKKNVRKKLWNDRNYVCMITHDIETSTGLRRSAKIKRLEEKYDVPSAWYVPTEEYKLDENTVRKLANHGEVGAHDTKHDGKLVHLSRGKITERVSKAKETLSRIVGEEIVGFRAPLLQHSAEILEALEDAGYKYDSSIPSWEPIHPVTMRPHGIETVYPLRLNGLTEIPVTLPQDHQLLHCLRMTDEEMLMAWTEAISAIKELEGVVTLAVHPDYRLASGNLDTYEELLNIIVADNQGMVTVPKRIVEQDRRER